MLEFSLGCRREIAVPRADADDKVRLARRDVRVDDVAALLDQRERRGRVLHDRVEQELALEQVLAFFAQHAAELVVRIDQLADFVAAARADREAEIAIAECDDAAGQRADQRGDRLRERAREEDRRDREHEHGRGGAVPRRLQPRGRRGSDRGCGGQVCADGEF